MSDTQQSTPRMLEKQLHLYNQTRAPRLHANVWTFLILWRIVRDLIDTLVPLVLKKSASKKIKQIPYVRSRCRPYH